MSKFLDVLLICKGRSHFIFPTGLGMGLVHASQHSAPELHFQKPVYILMH